MAFQTIGFIGLGLIGGSIAKKMKSISRTSKFMPRHIIKKPSKKRTVRADRKQWSVTTVCFFWLWLYFLCAPVQRNLAYLRQLKDIIRSDCYITDVGSTKTEIHEEVIRLGMEANFIGGHPWPVPKNRHIKCHQYAFGKCILYYHPDRPDSKGRNFGISWFCIVAWSNSTDFGL